MPHLALMEWNERDLLGTSATQSVGDGMAPTAHYVYDGGAQRIRKVLDRAAVQGQAATRLKERIYLGGFEVLREYAADGVALRLERQTLHLADGAGRIAMVETRTHGDDGSAAQLHRYQGGDHLGSATLELDADGRVISYEEYAPYGSSTYQGLAPEVTAAGKRYRWLGKEREEETGFAAHGVRYLMPSLGRWISADPAGLVDGPNLYAYARGNPANNIDTSGYESFNAGERGQTFRDDQGNVFVEFRATKGTWASASAQSLGLDAVFSKGEAYGAYVPGMVLDAQGQRHANTDKLEVGEIFYIRVGAPGGKTQPPPAPEPTPDPVDPVPPPSQPEVPEPPESLVKTAFRNAVDAVFFDKVAIEDHVTVGVEAMELAGGFKFFPVDVGVTGTLITNPNSPDFLKAAVNPGVALSGNVEFGNGQTVTALSPAGANNVNVGVGEFFGPSSGATIDSLPGISVGGSLGLEGQVGVGFQGSGNLSVSIPTSGMATWVDFALEGALTGSATAKLTGEGGANVKYTFDPIWQRDLMWGPMREYHKQYVDWINSGRSP